MPGSADYSRMDTPNAGCRARSRCPCCWPGATASPASSCRRPSTRTPLHPPLRRYCRSASASYSRSGTSHNTNRSGRFLPSETGCPAPEVAHCADTGCSPEQYRTACPILPRTNQAPYPGIGIGTSRSSARSSRTSNRRCSAGTCFACLAVQAHPAGPQPSSSSLPRTQKGGLEGTSCPGATGYYRNQVRSSDPG
jgi:hypothetical protein